MITEVQVFNGNGVTHEELIYLVRNELKIIEGSFIAINMKMYIQQLNTECSQYSLKNNFYKILNYVEGLTKNGKFSNRMNHEMVLSFYQNLSNIKQYIDQLPSPSSLAAP